MKIEKLNGGFSETLKPGDIVTPKDGQWGQAWTVQKEPGPLGENAGPFVEVKTVSGHGATVLLSELLLTSHSELQALAQFESIKAMIEQRNIVGAQIEAGEESDKAIEAANEEIAASALHIEVRSAWYSPQPWQDLNPGTRAAEFCLLLCTGGPAVRIIGELNEHGEPESARLEHQDWGTPWTEFKLFSEDDRAILLEFCQQFYFSC